VRSSQLRCEAGPFKNARCAYSGWNIHVFLKLAQKGQQIVIQPAVIMMSLSAVDGFGDMLVKWAEGTEVYFNINDKMLEFCKKNEIHRRRNDCRSTMD
jgi:hypothetical protein